MRDVIQRVIQVEGEARQLVQAARSESDRLVTDARVTAKRLIEQAKQEAKLESDDLLLAAEAASQNEKAGQLSRVAAEVQKTICLDEATTRAVADAAVRGICGFG